MTHALGGRPWTEQRTRWTAREIAPRRAISYAGVTTNYGYDAIYELLNTTQAGSTSESYTYDPVGNRLTDLGSASWSYNTSTS